MEEGAFVVIGNVEGVARSGRDRWRITLADAGIILRPIGEAAEQRQPMRGILPTRITDGAAEHAACIGVIAGIHRPRHAEQFVGRATAFDSCRPLIGREVLCRGLHVAGRHKAVNRAVIVVDEIGFGNAGEKSIACDIQAVLGNAVGILQLNAGHIDAGIGKKRVQILHARRLRPAEGIVCAVAGDFRSADDDLAGGRDGRGPGIGAAERAEIDHTGRLRPADGVIGAVIGKVKSPTMVLPSADIARASEP